MKDAAVDTNNDWLGWMLGGIVAVITSLAAAVTTLWAKSEAKNSEAIKDLAVKSHELALANAECEKDRRELFGRVSRLEEKVAFLQHLEKNHERDKQ